MKLLHKFLLFFTAIYSPRWAFLFDKVMLLCRKVTRLGFDVRYSPKHVFTVSTLSVDPVHASSAKGGKAGEVVIILYYGKVIIYFAVFLCLSFGG